MRPFTLRAPGPGRALECGRANPREKERAMQDPRTGVIQPDQEMTPEERDRRRKEAARELEDLKQAWLRT
jgi:hypothetical protein